MNNQETTIKAAAIKFDIFVRDGGIGASMFFVLIMLIIVNTHSLHYLFGDTVINWFFAIISAIGFSIATTAVIRKPVAKWMKFTFPLFDTFLVFLGFNLFNESIPVHFIMTVLFSLFSGAILIGLGTINYNEHIKESETDDYKSKIWSLESEITEWAKSEELLKVTISELEFKNSKLNSENIQFKQDLNEMKSLKSNYLSEIEKNHFLESNLDEFKVIISEFESEKSDYEKLKSDFEKAKKSLDSYKSQLADLEEYREGYFKFHKSRIEKKKPENRTAQEVELLNEFEKSGYTNLKL